MATATKKAPAKKAAPEKGESASAKKTEEAAARRAEREERDEKLTTIVVSAREDEVSWAEIATDNDITAGKAMFLHMRATIARKDKVNPDKMDEDALQEWVVVNREDEDAPRSWGWLSAASGLGEQKLRTLYSEGSGKEWLGQRIGKGGRYPGDSTPEGTKSTKATKSKGKADDLNPSKTHIADMNLKELKARGNGKTFTVEIGGKRRKIQVKAVNKRTKSGDVEITDTKGATRTFEVTKIKNVSR